MKEERLLPVGTRVFEIRFGWGVVVDNTYNSDYPIYVKFDGGVESYKGNGVYYTTYKAPLLSLTEYTLENGGFTPISEYWNKPKIGDWGYFWDRESDNVAVFGRLVNIETRNFGVENSGRWHNFSHEIPEHIKKQMEQK